MPYLLLAGLVGLGIYSLVKKGTAAKTFQFTLSGLRLDGQIGITGLPISFILRLTNPTNESLSFTSFIGQLSYNTKKLIDVSTINNIQIKPNANTDIIIRSVIPYASLISNGINIINGDYPKSLTITGILKCGAIELPVNQDLAFS